MVVCFLLLFLLIPNSSPSPTLRVSETNPSNVKATEIWEMENVSKNQVTKRSLGLLDFYINKLIRKMRETPSEKPKRKVWMLRYNSGIDPLLSHTSQIGHG